MKKCLRSICLILVLSMIVAFPVGAESQAESRASAFFSSYGASLYKTSSTSFQVWFDVDSNLATMDEIGVSYIEIYRSSDQNSWTLMRTYEMDDYPEMIDENTSSHTGYVTYPVATPGFYYCAYVTFYAKNNTGVGMRSIYTDILQM